jgi:RimJ/RimL family protein N-acetyltransferase
MRTPFLIGDRIYLRVLEESDITEENISWINDAEATEFLEMTGAFPGTVDTMKQWLQRYTNNTNNIAFAIVDKENDRHIGNITLTGINWIHRSAIVPILIGAKDYWGKGIGTEAQSLVIDYAFNRLGLRKMIHTPIAANIGSVRMAEKLGFQLEGVMREEVFLEGKYHDQLRMGLFPHEFRKFTLKG